MRSSCPVWEDAKHLFAQIIFRYAIVIIQSGLRSPTNVEGRIDMGLSPLQNPAQLRPIIHLFEREMFDWRASDEHAVEFLTSDIVPIAVKNAQVIPSRIL